MGEFNLSTIVGTGSIVVTVIFFLLKGGYGDKIKALFAKKQNKIKDKLEKLELQEQVHRIEVREAELKVNQLKSKAETFIKNMKKEIDETGTIKEPEKLLKEFNKW